MPTAECQSDDVISASVQSLWAKKTGTCRINIESSITKIHLEIYESLNSTFVETISVFTSD